MPTYRKVDAETRTRALVLVEEGYSFRAVGTRLRISHNKTVFRVVHKCRQTGSVADKPRNGRTIEVDDATTGSNPYLEEPGKPSAYRTRTTSADGRGAWGVASIENCPPALGGKKSLLRDATVHKRLVFARDWTVAQWDSVLWSDESTFQLFRGA